MQIKNHIGNVNQQAGSKSRVRGRANWQGALLGCLVLISVFAAVLVPFGGWSAAPGLQIGPFTTNSGMTFITVTITNGSSTNTYEIDSRVAFTTNFPWVGSIFGTQGQTGFSIPVGPEGAMFFRAIDCVDCDGDGILNWKDANPLNSNILTLMIYIQSPTNGADIY